MRFDYSRQDIVDALRNIGIGEADDVFIHSNLGFYGILQGCMKADDLCEQFISAIQEVVGPEGTIICPAFSYSYCHNEIYDPCSTKTTCGMLSEYLIRKYPQNRTLDPNFSVCGIGKISKYLDCNIHEAFGKDSFFERFLLNEGKIICMNFDAGSTFIHYIERSNNVSYRHNKAFNGESVIHGEHIRDYAVHFVFEKEEDGPCMERVHQICSDNNVFKEVELGKGTILAFPVKEYFDLFSELLKTRPRVLCRVEED